MKDQFSVEACPIKSDWDIVVKKTSKSHINQTWEWGDLLQEMRGMSPIRLLVRKEKEPVALMQAFDWRWGPVHFSLICGDSGSGGGTCVADDVHPEDREKIMELLLKELRTIGLEKKSLQLALFASVSAPDSNDNLFKKSTAWTPILNLDPDPERMLQEKVDQKTRNQILKSFKNGIVVSEGAREDLAMYRQLQMDLVAKKNLPMKFLNPASHLYALWDAFAPLNGMKLFLSRKGDEVTGGAIILYNGKNLIYKSGITTEKGRTLYAGNALQWHIISDAAQRGYVEYNMAGGTPDATHPRFGITQFKLGFGAKLASFSRYTIIPRRTTRFIVCRVRKCLAGAEWPPPFIYP